MGSRQTSSYGASLVICPAVSAVEDNHGEKTNHGPVPTERDLAHRQDLPVSPSAVVGGTESAVCGAARSPDEDGALQGQQRLSGKEVVKLRWDWEIPVPELGTCVFLIPADFGGRHDNAGVKNGDERQIVLNRAAKSVIEGQRGLDPLWVFPYGQPDKDATPPRCTA